MQDFVARMRTESDALKIKIDKALEFMCTDIFKGLTTDEKSMLHSQVHAMQAYYEILSMRIRFYAN